ncbi:MAG TPA: HAMP domain-containing sensor histidine kinase [Aldersonia sp.]
MLLDLLPRPLDPVRSFKVKVGLLVTGSLAMSVLVFWFLASWQWRYALLAALVAALALTQILAHGMTSPLREMTKASRAMSNGDYSIRVRATSRDEIGELARAFNKMSADLDAADQNRRELIANVSHELRTPISALHAVLENIVDGVAPADPAAMRTALAQTERLGLLVSDLLDLSRIEGGATALWPAEFAVADFVHEAVRHAPPSLRNVRTIVDVRPPTLTAAADTVRLHQVMANLLGNAARHSPPGGTVTVRARRDDAGLQIDVVDEGPGIADADREWVFERFTRGGSTDGGTGLGLAIARWAVELHGGAIDVVGSGPGCRIRVLIPDVASPNGVKGRTS